MATICLVTPGHLGSNPRIVKEADALSQQGHRVHVVYAQTHQRDLDRDASILKSARWQAHPVRGLASSLAHSPRRLRQLAAASTFRYCSQSLHLAILAQHQLASRLRKTVVRIPADLYIAHYVAALPAVAEAARLQNSSYAFDAEDFHSGEWPDDREFDFYRQLIRTIEAAFLPGCRYVTAASPGIADAYASAYGIPMPVVVRNVFPLAHSPMGPTPRGVTIPGPSLYWFSQTIGPDRGLECSVRAIALAKSTPHLYLRGFISETFHSRLIELARMEGVQNRLHFLAPAAPDQMETLSAAYDLGLVAETGHTENRRIALTNKLFTFALAGVPAVISDIQSHRDYVSEAAGSARLFLVDNPVSLADAIDSFLMGDGHALAESRLAAFDLGRTRLNWDLEQLVFLSCVERSLEPG